MLENITFAAVINKGIVITVLLTVLCGVVSCVSGQDGIQNLRARLAARAGSKSTDCGFVPIGGDRHAADECAVRAFRTGIPFFVTYQLQGIDSTIAAALIRGEDNALRVISYDSDIRGGGGRAFFPKERVLDDVCTSPEIVQVDGKERIRCPFGFYQDVT
jgi:hypothetical protein